MRGLSVDRKDNLIFIPLTPICVPGIFLNPDFGIPFGCIRFVDIQRVIGVNRLINLVVKVEVFHQVNFALSSPSLFSA